jgi:molecular chaperone HscB
MDYFELFNIPVSLFVDASGIKKRFYELSRKYHPDFFSNASNEDQSESLEMSAMLNKALKVFSNPDETIKYVLLLKGLLVEEEKYQLPNDFLMDVMDINEQLMDAKMDGDEAQMTTLKQQIANLQTDIYEPVKNIVEHYQEGVTSEKELLQVKKYYFQKKYLARMLASIN